MEKLKNDPYPYCHLYNLFVGSNHGRGWIQYVLHCDYPQPSDKRNHAEIKRRLGWSLQPLTIFKINVVKKDYQSGKNTKISKCMESKV